MNFQDLQNIEGLQFMPVMQNKQPIVKGWQTLFKKHDLGNCQAVGLVCGKLSGNLEAIDIDLKYDLTGKLFDNYKRLINESDPNLLKKLVVQKTQSGGYHFLYRCSKIEGNLKLANRETTEKEKNETYQAEINSGKNDLDARKIASKDKIRVLLETRGEGGYIMCFPSNGYEIVYGDYYGINQITVEERETLHNIARQFNKVIDEFKPQYKPENNSVKVKGISPFDDYNDRGDVVGLLESFGWKVVGQKGSKTVVLRAGQTSSKSSGNYDHDRKWFTVFTTSTEFEPQKAYLPYSVFAILECNGDYKEAVKRLYDLGFGERREVIQEINRKTPSYVSPIDDDYSFAATPKDYEEKLNLARKGQLPMGKTTGMPALDKNFMFKEGNVVMTNGHDNVGKSVVVWYLSLLSAMYHDWNWVIFSSENSLFSFMRKMIEFYWGKPIYGIGAMNDMQYQEAKNFIESHFTLIKSEEELYNYKDIINMNKKLLKKKKYHCGLIDPYNSLKIELTASSKLSTHEYHYEALSELKLFSKKTGMGLYINNHAVTGALRQKDGDKKYPVAPQKADTEGGGKFSNKADDFITIHRLTQHPRDWMLTELHIRKIKETESGGHVTPNDNPVRMAMQKGGCSFMEIAQYTPEDGGMHIYGVDPVQKWHERKLTPTTINFNNFNELPAPNFDTFDENPF